MKSSKGKLKSARGLTLLEILLALSVAAVLIPVLSVVFYQMTVLPSDNSTQLSLNNEVSQLAEMLYQDGYMAEEFVAGDGKPYYGNFSWTNYSTGDCYLVSYYYVDNCSNGPCDRIVRQVTITHNCTTQSTPTSTATVTPTPTPSPTPSPTPTPTPTPVPTLYTFCSGGGTDKWAWGRTWSNIDGNTNGHPTNPSDFLTFISTRLPPYQVYTATEANYAAMCSVNSSGCTTGDGVAYWRYADISDPLEFNGFDSQLFVFKIYQDRTSVTNLSVVWAAHGSQGEIIYHTRLKIWNYQTNSWSTLVDVTSDTGSKCFNQYTYSITTNPGYYIQSGSGNVSLMSTAVCPSIPATQGIYTDYIALNVSTTP